MKALNIHWSGLKQSTNRTRAIVSYVKTTLMKKVLYFLFGLILLNSCIKEIDIPIEYTDPKLVLNGFFTSDSIWNVHLSASKYIYASGEIPIVAQAAVTIHDGTDTLSLIPQGDGYYRSSTQKPQIGHTYTIEVSHADYETITGNAVAISAVPLKSLEKGEKVLIDGYEYRKIRIKFDDPSETNFYRINFKRSMKEPDWSTVEDELDSIWTNYPDWVMYQDANNSMESGYSSTSSMLISDYYFNGNEHTIDVFLDDYYFQEGYYNEQNAHLVIEFYTVSKEYFYFASSLENYNNSDDFALFASQPVQIFTNIENGLGVFASYASQVDSIKLGL